MQTHERIRLFDAVSEAWGRAEIDDLLVFQDPQTSAAARIQAALKARGLTDQDCRVALLKHEGKMFVIVHKLTDAATHAPRARQRKSGEGEA